MLQALAVIGEAARHTSSELKSRYQVVPWSAIVAFRNAAVHAYFGLDLEAVWWTATQEVPLLRQ